MSPRKFVEATESSTLILWARASAEASPTVVPASTVPGRWIAPVRARIASSSVVLPAWNGPTSAMARGPLGPLPFAAGVAAIDTSLTGDRLPVFRVRLEKGRRTAIVSGDGGRRKLAADCLFRLQRLAGSAEGEIGADVLER